MYSLQAHIHIYSLTLKHTCPQTHTHNLCSLYKHVFSLQAHIHIYSLALTHTHACTHMHTHISVFSLQACVLSTSTHTHTLTHTHTHTHICVLSTSMCSLYKHTYTYSNTHTHTHTHTHTPTQTHSHCNYLLESLDLQIRSHTDCDTLHSLDGVRERQAGVAAGQGGMREVGCLRGGWLGCMGQKFHPSVNQIN